MTTSAQSKLDLSAASLAQRVMASEVLSRSGENVKALPAPVAIDDKVAVVVTLAPGEDASVLEERGFEVLTTREDMAIVRMSAPEMLAAAEMAQVKGIALSPEAHPLLYAAKKGTGVNPILEGSPEVGGNVYDGTGIVVGLMDKGLDVNNPNFLNKDGKSRASRVFVITGNTGAITTYDTPEKIANFTTDDSDETHGTHVLGCMAGSFTDKFTKVAFINANTGSNQIASNRWTSATDYRGPAIAADIAAACGTTEGTNILLAAEKVYSYAKSQGKPCVMNISLGHNTGPHDGTDANSRYLESIGKDMIICVSAGNEGTDAISLHKEFTASSKEIKTFPSMSASASGVVDIWGYDASIYKVTFQIFERATGKVVWSYTVDKNLNSTDKQETMAIITSSNYNMPTYIHNAAFDKAFGNSSAVFIATKVDPSNNRYNTQVTLQLGGSGNAYYPAIAVEGNPGQSVDMFASGRLAFYSNGIAGYTNGNPDNSINGIATAKNVLAIGAYVNETSIPTLQGLARLNTRYKKGDIADFSSYGTTFDGRVLPHVAGPGMAVISSLSSYYTAKLDPKSDEIAQSTAYKDATFNKQNRTYYWCQMSGTSMSSPFTAGVIALWLQADPTLKYDDVVNILNETSVRDQYVEAAPNRFGAGRLDALAGMKKVLNLTGIADIMVDASDFIVTPTGRRSFEVFAAGANGIRAELYSLSGMLAATASASGDTANLDASAATPGVYVLRSTADNGRVDSRKIVIK